MVEDGDCFVYAVALEGVAGLAVVVDEVVLDKLDGHGRRVVQRDSVVRDLRDGVLVVHVEDLHSNLETRRVSSFS